MSAKTMANATSSASDAKPSRTLVLASTSRYRRALLEQLGLAFVVERPDADETPLAGEVPAQTALRLSEAKARSVAALHPHALIIGSDQVADHAGQPIGKPGNHAHAVEQLTALSGQTVVFHTGVALLDAATGDCQSALIDVRSTFASLRAPRSRTICDAISLTTARRRSSRTRSGSRSLPASTATTRRR
jgi:MAF protein